MDNLKVMTGLEESSTEGLKNGIERFVEENKKAIKELLERKEGLLNELKEYGGSRLLKKEEENEQ